MNLVLEIVLVVCCIGVTYSSPTNTAVTDVVSSEKLPKVNSELPADHNKNDPPTPTASAKPMPIAPNVQPVKDAATANSTNKEEAVVTNNKNNTKDAVTISNNNGLMGATNMTTNNTNVASGKAADIVPSLQEYNSSTTTPAQAVVSTEKANGTTTTTPLNPAPTPSPTHAPAGVTTQTSKVTTTTGSPISKVTTPLAAKADNVIPVPTAQERQFDSPSFIGGIVLTVGLTAIGFIAFKFYKSGTVDRNYRTL